MQVILMRIEDCLLSLECFVCFKTALGCCRKWSAQPWTCWEPPTPTVTVATRWLGRGWTGHRTGPSTNTSTRTGTSSGTLGAWDGQSERKHTSRRAAIGTEVSLIFPKSIKLKLNYFFIYFYKTAKPKFLISGGLDSKEPWQGQWNGGVLVECIGRPGPEIAGQRDLRKNLDYNSNKKDLTGQSLGPKTSNRTEIWTFNIWQYRALYRKPSDKTD